MNRIDNNVLVTGATGFLGRHVIRELRRYGYAVSAMVREIADARLDPSVRLVQGDLNVHEPYARLCIGYTTVIHLAAFIPPSWTDASLAAPLLERNALATLHLAQAAHKAGVRRFIYATSGNVYRHGSVTPTEDDPVFPSTFATYYLASKLAGEIYVEHLRLVQGLSSITLRLSSIFGPGMPTNSAVSQFMSAARKGDVLQVRDGGLATYDLVYVEDVVGAIINSINCDQPGIYNVGSGVASTVADIARAAISQYPDTGASINLFPVVGTPFPGFPALCIDRARSGLGFSPRSLAAGLAAMREAVKPY